MPAYLCTYYPDYDAINNCGFPQPINDFHGSEYGTGDDDMCSVTKHLPTEPDSSIGFDAEGGGVVLRVPAMGLGFTWLELRTAANAYRALNELGCYRTDGYDSACCGEPILHQGVCYDHSKLCAVCGEEPCDGLQPCDACRSGVEQPFVGEGR